MILNTTLLREKFLIRDGRGDDVHGEPVTAVSNRILLPLLDAQGNPSETFVIRAHSMHMCIRMAAQIIVTYERSGPLMVRSEKFNFDVAWDGIQEDHERKYHPESWCAVYHNGRVIFSSGEHHMFLDMIEKCDSRNPGDYDQAVFLAEEAFASLGKQVTISHDSTIGMVANIEQEHGRCGLILRNPNRRTTFNIMAEAKTGRILSAAQFLIVSAAFLEGIQIAFQIGSTAENIRLEKVQKYSEDDRRAESGRRRLNRLYAEISAFENEAKVRYRPERPEFALVISDAETYTREQHIRRLRKELAEKDRQEKGKK